MKKYLRGIIYFAVLLLVSILSSCHFDKEEVLYPKSSDGCDTLNVTYTNYIAPIMVDNCNGCHGGSFPEAGIRTDNYNDLKDLAENNSLAGVVNHEPGYSPMPKDKPKLSDCDLKQINAWIESGVQE